MSIDSLLIPPSGSYWANVARAVLDKGWLAAAGPHLRDFSGVQVMVPDLIHAQFFRKALADQLQRPFIPPRIITLARCLSMLPPDVSDGIPVSHSERMMALYAELRQHAWLKKLFSAQRNTDLLPLAQVLLSLFDELTEALLPVMQLSPDAAEERWQSALGQLPLPMCNILSDEAQLVWSLWKSQIDSSDRIAVEFARMMRLAEEIETPLVWIDAVRPGATTTAFLQAYAQRQPVLQIGLDWRAEALDPIYCQAWPEIVEQERQAASGMSPEMTGGTARRALSLSPANSLEDEARRGAQTVVNWLHEGKRRIAIVAQDRRVARRIRALLERAHVFIADEAGWKLSTTRSAAAVAALLDVVSTRAETLALLDLLKSPFLCAHMPDKAVRVMEIEHALRRRNVLGGWNAIFAALGRLPEAYALISLVATQAELFHGRKTLVAWAEATNSALHALGMRDALDTDAAGEQLVALLDQLAQDGAPGSHSFSFAEWRAFLGLQLESTPFAPPISDQRVVMLQLNGLRLRSFDAVLLVGADADHLPSQVNETLFFANNVRRELGLATREVWQCMQLRNLAELLSSCECVVLSWQLNKNGEPNALSPWIERLQLALERAGSGRLPLHRVVIEAQRLVPSPPAMPRPSAPQLLPLRLSASDYNSLVACPYQFFATRMLGLSAMDELSDTPEKHDYGDWLHEILRRYHETLRRYGTEPSRREFLLREISETVFAAALEQSQLALGYYARWQRAIPAYLAWSNEREAQGWQFILGEQRFDKTIAWEGGQVTLHGCIDRIDENEVGERAVLDYKIRPLQSLREKLKESEDHQLAFYGLLSDLPVVAGHYVALEATRDKTGDVQAANYNEWQQKLEEQIVGSARAIAEGAELPATGIERICVFCEVRGLCRKGAW